MRLTRQTNHAIQILMYCAVNDGRLSRVAEIAAAYHLSELFLFKILQPLVEAGFVQTTRGRNGGITLARPAEDITLRAVVEATEESFSMAGCFDAGPSDCPLLGVCELSCALSEALAAFLAVLQRYTIASIVADRGILRQRLGIATGTDIRIGF